MKKADAVLCADLHWRPDIPISRTDDYQAAQFKKIDFIDKLAQDHNCPIYVAGDVFHKARSNKAFEISLINTLQAEWIAIPGNHDLPGHNEEKLFDSSLGILQAAGSVFVFPQRLESVLVIANAAKDRTIGMIHKLVHGDVKITAGDKVISYSAKKLLKENPECDIIVSGDNHQTFFVREKGRLLVNPGSMMRMTADQQNHKPSVFLYYADDNTVEQVFLPIEKDVISREHIDKVAKNNKRLDTFIQKMNDQFELSLSFEKNIEAYFKTNDTREPVKDIVWELVS